jgi:GntR family transcriptional regulator/MocR family aminotransferase
MTAEWTNSVSGLLLRLERDSPVPLRSQLEQALRHRIQSGRLAAGDLLPPSRRLAAHLGVSRGLVVDCYAQLTAEGYLTSHVGSATRVAIDAKPLPSPEDAMVLAPAPQIEFQPGVPDLSSFPRRELAAGALHEHAAGYHRRRQSDSRGTAQRHSLKSR